MSVKIYDSTIGAFKDAETPLIWDEQAQAWKDSVGLVWNESAQAWEERWGDNKLWLYKDGDERIDVTGGYSVYTSYTDNPRGYGTANKTSTYLELVSPSYAQRPTFITNKPIDYSRWNYVCAELTYIVQSQTGINRSGIYVGFLNNYGDRQCAFGFAYCRFKTGTDNKITLKSENKMDISGFDKSGQKYFRVGIDAGGDSIANQTVYIHKLWLEK